VGRREEVEGWWSRGEEYILEALVESLVELLYHGIMNSLTSIPRKETNKPFFFCIVSYHFLKIE